MEIILHSVKKWIMLSIVSKKEINRFQL